MLFHSPEFIILMFLTLAVYLLWPKFRIQLLAMANAFFYGVSGLNYLVLFVAVLVLTHFCAVRVRGNHGRLYLWLGVGTNLINLALFKYTYFFATNLNRWLHWETLDPNFWKLVLPIGISFYTFQLIAYLVDVYRGTIPPAASLLQCWVFIAFFGQLIAGPIMRGEDFLPQVASVESRRVTLDQIRYGLYLFAFGMAKKVLAADPIGQRVDRLWGEWRNLTGLECWLAGSLFAFQVYYDFSAYSDMALGIGHLFGFELTSNFRTPLLAGNPAEFWRRWHITLSTWIRDYIYIPLGGNRRGAARAYLNQVIAMTLSGLWHGAAWTFVIWGLFHGVIAAGHKLWVRHVAGPLGLRAKDGALRWLSILLFFTINIIGWVLFRATSWEEASTMLGRMFFPAAWRWSPDAAAFLPAVGLLLLLHLAEFWLRHKEGAIFATWRNRVPRPIRALAYTAVAVLLLVMTDPRQGSFIYFQF